MFAYLFGSMSFLVGNLELLILDYEVLGYISCKYYKNLPNKNVKLHSNRNNNGMLEGLKFKRQLTKKELENIAYKEIFIHMIYFICGKLKFYYPLQTT